MNQRISFSEYVLRYTQLTGIDTSRLHDVFYSFEPISDGSKARPLTVIARAFRSLKIDFDPIKLDSWCSHRFNSGNSALLFSEFVVAYLLFIKVSRRSKRDKGLCNEGLHHKNRIVQLQDSGHVRLSTRAIRTRCKKENSEVKETTSEEHTEIESKLMKFKIKRNQDERKDESTTDEDEKKQDSDKVDSVYRQGEVR